MKQVTKQFTNIQDGIKNLIKAANADYCDGNTNERMCEEFKNGWTIKEGKKYIGIYKTLGLQQCIWGGVVKKDSANGLLKKGDILKPAGWNAPARNYKRGNVLEGNYLMNWTGPVYMS